MGCAGVGEKSGRGPREVTIAAVIAEEASVHAWRVVSRAGVVAQEVNQLGTFHLSPPNYKFARERLLCCLLCF